jgi:hypothetical protein
VTLYRVSVFISVNKKHLRGEDGYIITVLSRWRGKRCFYKHSWITVERDLSDYKLQQEKT